MSTSFLLLHGYGGTHPEHWQEYLANHLKDKKRKVIYPKFPDPDHPQLDKWIAYLENQLKDVNPTSLVVAAHSLGCSIWLQYIAKHPDIKPKKVFLVAPPLTDCDVIEIESFFPLPDIDLSDQKENYLIISSNNDPFILENEFDELAKRLNIPHKKISNAGHINAPIHGDWEWINKECFKQT